MVLNKKNQALIKNLIHKPLTSLRYFLNERRETKSILNAERLPFAAGDYQTAV